MFSYSQQYILAICVAVLAAGVGAIQLADPASLGLSPVFVNWTKVITPGLTILAGVLPKISQKTDPSEPTPPKLILPSNPE